MKNAGKKLKRAFTLVSLSVTVAVIAVIIAVTTPVFVKLISSANLTSDKVTVKSLNDTLSINEASNGKPYNVISAFEGLYQNGYSAEVFILNDGNLVYDLTSNRLIIYSDDYGSVIYPESNGTAKVKAAYSAVNCREDLYVIGTEGVEAAVNAGFTNFYLYSTESTIKVDTQSTITLWIYTEAEDVQIIAENAVVYHNKSTADCTSLFYVSLSDSSYNTAYIEDDDACSSSGTDTETSEETDSGETDGSSETGTQSETSEEQDSGAEDPAHTGGGEDSGTDTDHENKDPDNSDKDTDTDTDTQESDTRSGDEENQTEPAHNHQYGEWQIIIEASCSADGLKRQTCDCGDYVEEVIPQSGHEYAATITPSTVDEKGFTTYTCTHCNESYTGDVTDYLCTEGLKFEKTADSTNGNYYVVTGIADDTATDVYIPSYYKSSDDGDYLPVLEIATKAFYCNAHIKTVTIGCTIQKIGDYAFYECKGLTEINIPRDLKTFGTSCICRCTYLSKIYYEAISADDDDLDGQIFQQAGYYSNELIVYISKDVERMPKYIFNNTGTDLQACIDAIIFEEGSVCTEIAKGAFNTILTLQTLVLPSTITTIKGSSFDNISDVNIYFMGTKDEWDESVLNTLEAKNIYFYSETSADGCWYYDEDGVITLWPD